MGLALSLNKTPGVPKWSINLLNCQYQNRILGDIDQKQIRDFSWYFDYSFLDFESRENISEILKISKSKSTKGKHFNKSKIFDEIEDLLRLWDESRAMGYEIMFRYKVCAY